MSPHIPDSPNFIVLDSNVWISLITVPKNPLWVKIKSENYQIILTSYMICEILRVLRRITARINISIDTLNSAFWDLVNSPFIHQEFDIPLSEDVIKKMKDHAGVTMIAQIFQLEPKDVPYLVAAYQFKAIFITRDIRSIIEKRELIDQKLNIKIFTENEFLKKKLKRI